MAKREKKKKKKGGAVVGVGALLIAALLAFDPFGFGFGEGLGLGLPVNGNDQDEGDKENDGEGQEDQKVTETPQQSVTPEPTEAPTETPAPTEGAGEVTLKEVLVEVDAKKILYGGEEAESAQKLAEQIAGEYQAELANVIVKIHLKDAVYDTVETLKLALEGSGLKYEIAE